ncbi:MAG: aminodeoxychorismate/anthranilate synthase component II [Pseudanabaenaceae cyanobacterium bins.68]|nr:aminodeoxychorismate/anthranilate synthase component II [Pseudanabaenaceae cyanobacterium bins.68]
MILVIDNYDSFTYNLVQYLGELSQHLPHLGDVVVYRNDQIDLEGVKGLNPAAIVISPGPGRPEQAGISLEILQDLAPNMPILGVCLGHQSMGIVYGGQVVLAPYLMHGKTSEIFHDGKGIFTGVANPFIATRYHSLVIDPASLPPNLEVSAQTADGIIMGVRHRQFPQVEGVQFHPESILTLAGKQLLANFLSQIQ